MEEKVKIKKRNNYIDVIKGIAAIMVVIIHTAFHSGNSYVPVWFANITLLFEVPIFIFLAGWSYSYTSSNKKYAKSLLITQIKYMIFMLIIFIAICITNYIGLSKNPVTFGTLIKWFYHDYSSTAPIYSVEWSLWFFAMYFIVAILGMGIIKISKPVVLKVICILCILFTIMTTFFFPNIAKIKIGIELGMIIFYLFFYILGYLIKEKELQTEEFILLTVISTISLIVIQYVSKINVADIQGNKFPPNYIYMLWSSFGIYLVMFLKKFFINCKENILSNIGKNSLYVFLAQGIGASVLCHINEHLGGIWYLKFIIMLEINLIVTAICTLILKVIFDFIDRKIKKKQSYT